MQRLIDAGGAPLPGAPLGALLTAQAEADPHRRALTWGERHWTRLELDIAANRRARWLQAQGVGQDDIVVLALPNSAEWYVTAFAAWKIGATPVHVSYRLAPNELREITALCQPDIIISALDLPGHVAPAPLGAEIDGSPLPPRISPHWRISTSGGSTGRPKLVVDPENAAWSPVKEGRRRPPGSRMINPAPMYHSAPFGLMLMALAQGSHVIDMGRFDPEKYLALVAEHRANWAYLVPTMMARIARLPIETRQAYDVSSLDTVLHMAAPCAPWVKRAWIDWLGPEKILEVYGGSERLGATAIDGNEWLQHPGSVGRPPAGSEIAILDEHGQALPPGTVGEINFRQTGPAKFQYISDVPFKHAEWESFGDLGWLDAEGYLYLADRRTDMVVSAGVNYYPAEIEAALEACPGVVGSVVFGLPDEDLGQVLHAAIQTDPNAPAAPDAAALYAWLEGRLGKPKWPRAFHFVDEPIRDEAGKVRRSRWRERFLKARGFSDSPGRGPIRAGH
jgi:bile acid-coenzyme A ligase